MVGSRFVELYTDSFEFLTPDLNVLDITDKESVKKYFSDHDFDAVINFAAFTDVKKAELERGNKKGEVWKINVEGVRNLIKVCNKKGTFFIQISTNLVFEGTGKRDQRIYENSVLPKGPSKLSWYGWTKCTAEKSIISNSKKYAIARIISPYRAKYSLKKDYVSNIISLYKDDNLYPLFTDNVMTPTLIDEFCVALQKIVNESIPGVFHLVSNNGVSHYEFARYLLEKLGYDSSRVKTRLMTDYVNKSGIPRAVYCFLDSKNTQRVLKMKFSSWQDSVDELIKQIKGLYLS